MSPPCPDPWVAIAAQVAATSTPNLHKWRQQLTHGIRLSKAKCDHYRVQHGWDAKCGRPLLGLVEIQLLLRNETLPPL